MGAFSKLFARLGRPSSSQGGSERRVGYRQAVDCLAIAMVGGRAITVQVENISPGGAFLTPRIDAVKGSRFTLRVPEAGVSMQASVARHGSQGTGIYFDDSNTAERVVELFAAA